MTDQLLTRDQFRDAVFLRDSHKCVVCGAPAADAHHILERRLWPDGGYYLSNGASVCPQHHIECEQTTISVDQLRLHAGITKYVIPPHLYRDQEYDKWGNPILPNGLRLRGDLFYDESVQKILTQGRVIDLFTHLVKYPRTYHLPWSPGMNSDDRQMTHVDRLIGRRVIVTEKMDGECTTCYSDYIHARSVTSGGHPSRDWVKSWHAMRAHDIPLGWRVTLENVFAKHSIEYSDLDTFAYIYGVWNEHNQLIDWDEVVEWSNLLGAVTVPVIYDGLFDRHAIDAAYAEYKKTLTRESEGYVLRLAREVNYGEFRSCVGKYVRANHVQTVQHWLHGQPITPNKLTDGKTGF